MLQKLAAVILLGLALLHDVAASITPRNWTLNLTLGPRDQMSVKMVELFNLGQSKGAWFTSSKGKVYNATTELVTKSLQQYNMNEIHQIIDLGNSLVGVLYDKRYMMIIPISSDGKAIGTPKVFVEEKFGSKEICDDIVVNTNAARIYMSCHDENASAEEPGNSYIYEIDYQTLALIQKITIDQSDGFYVEYVSKLRLVSISQGMTRQRILVFYSQYFVGTAASGFSHNRFFRYCLNADIGNLNCDPKFVVNLTNSNLNFRVINDIYSYGNQLIFVGVPTQGGVAGAVSLRSCQFEYQDMMVNCLSEQKDSNITRGWAGLTNNNKYIEVDLLSKTIELCDLFGSFSDDTWNTNCNYKDAIDVFDDSSLFVREVEMDNSASIIEFVHPDSSYYGFSVHVFFSGNYHGDYKSTFPATLAEDKLVRLNPDNATKTVGIVWLVPEFVLIDAKDFSSKAPITITAYDIDTPSGVKVTFYVESLPDYIGDVRINPHYKQSEVDILQGSYYRWPLNQNVFLGNALEYSLGLPSEIADLFEQHIYHTAQVDINLNSDDPSNLDLTQVVTGQGFLIGIDRRNNLVFYSCTYTGIATASCSLKAAMQQQAGIKLAEKTSSVGKIAFVYTTTKDATVIYLFDGNSVGNYTMYGVYPDDVDAFLASESDGRQVGAIAIAQNDKKTKAIHLLQFNVNDVTSMRSWTYLTAANTQDGYLCPTKVNGKNSGFLAVTSLCYGEVFADTRIVVFSFPGPRSVIEIPLPNNGSMTIPKACYFGHSLLIYGFDAVNNKTNLYMTGGLDDDPSEEHFGLEDYGITDVQSVHCAEEDDLISVFGNNADGTKTMVVFYAYSRGFAIMRAHSVKKNLKISDGASFGTGNGAMVHVIYDMDGYPFYLVSYNHGPAVYTDVSTDLKKQRLFDRLKGEDKVRNFSVEYQATNPKDKMNTVKSTFTLRAQDTTITVSPKKSVTASKDTTIDLEELIDIDGPVFNLDLNGVDRFEDVILTHRIETTLLTRRSGGLSYKYIVMAAQRTYCVESQNEYTKVDFYEHGEFVKTLAGLGIAGELLSFTAVTIDYVRGVDVLFYSYFEGKTPKIVIQIYENGIRRSGEISFNRAYAHDLKGVRVNSKKVYLFAQNEREIEFYVITIPDLSSATFERIDSFQGFYDFSVVYGGPQVVIIGFGYDSRHFMGYSISSQNASSISGPKVLSPTHEYNLYKVNCKNFNTTHLVCVANTQASFLTENYIDFSMTTIETHTHDKYGYYEGFEVDIAGEYLFMFGKTNKPGVFSMAILCWKTRKSGGDGKLWYGLNLPVPNDRPLEASYQAPFVASYDDGDPNQPISYLLVGFLLDTIPMGVFENSTFKINLKNENLDLRRISLSFQGLSSAEITLNKVFDTETETTKALPWWPFALLVGLLVLAAVGWFIYVRIKSEKEATATASGQYETVGETDGKKTMKDL